MDRIPQMFVAGQILITENDLSKKMYILQSGKARVFKTYLGKKVTLAVLGEGEIVGELSFFDGQPRSASVEALTDVKALVIDGDAASKQVEQLPDWVVPVLRKIFHRFRELDKQVVVLQSVADYQRKVFKIDRMAQAIYQELLRYARTLELVCREEGWASAERVEREMDAILGARIIGLRAFWKALTEFDVIQYRGKGSMEELKVNRDPLAELQSYLARELQSERHLILGHPAIAVLCRVIGLPESVVPRRSASLEELRVGSVHLADEGLEELVRHRVLGPISGGEVAFDPATLRDHYVHQSILKAFDRSTLNVE